MKESDKPFFDAVIIGAGFSGLYQLHSLRDKLDMNCHLFETASGVGGTWFWNRYPGARCDTESHAYCYYFNKELYEKWDWSERYPSQREIESYLNFIADNLDLYRDISFKSCVTELIFNEDKNNWEIKLENGKSCIAQFVITALGCLSSVNMPFLPGMKSFSGEIFHTANWPKSNVDFNGKNVGIIGTGSTGIQIIPEIASRSKSLSVFQRTSNYSIPAQNHFLKKKTKILNKSKFDELKKIALSNKNGHPWEHSDKSASSFEEQQRKLKLIEAWEHGGLRFRDCFSDINNNETTNVMVSEFISSQIKEIINDVSSSETLSTFDHPFGAKRPALDTGYFETFNKVNVELVNLKEEPIKKFDVNGLWTLKSFKPLDMVIFATGFDAITGPLLKIKITGRKKRTLSKEWKHQTISLLGLQVPGFPNLFTITGPGSPSVLTNMPRAIEQHVEWITKCIDDLKSNKKLTIEATDAAAQEWKKEVHKAAETGMFLKTSHSWYLGTNIDGKPVGFIPYAGGLNKYRAICEDSSVNNYKGFLIK